jgi:hypothetical protein
MQILGSYRMKQDIDQHETAEKNTHKSDMSLPSEEKKGQPRERRTTF